MKPDVWFILIDETLPSMCLEQINEVFSNVDGINVEIVQIRDWPSNSEVLLDANERFKNCEIQVRLDYDDMLHRDFMKELLKETAGIKKTTVFSPIFGIVLDNRVPKMAVIKKTLPPFLLLVRKDREDEINIFSFKHDQWPSHLVCELKRRPMWLQAITGRNLANEFGRGWMVTRVRHMHRLHLSDWNGQQTVYSTSALRVTFLNVLERIEELKKRLVSPRST